MCIKKYKKKHLFFQLSK
ncbi:hypothetical protein OIU84_026525 [Salix udensis]|uniref:Uncharacterized protein n=1 Tax=Salix udensis TaxID=889485 RepID=A0AAD6KP98_9ROSI|nr:hypothetical protein OIU84_026525 [Salix udensis]